MGVILPSTSRSRAAVARRAHNPKVAGSIPAFATTGAALRGPFFIGFGPEEALFLYLGRMKVGFVSIFGKPNAGKSTLLNALMGEKLAIVSPKVQTTRHRIKGILTEKDYQIIFSDTPGIIEPRYKLHEKMMQAVRNSLEDADVSLLLVDVNDNWEENDQLF